MALPVLVEELLSLSKNTETGFPGTLLYRAGFEYYYPFVPPYTISTIVTGVSVAGLIGAAAQRGYGTQYAYPTPEVIIHYGITFGKIEPGAFHIRAVVAGNVALDGRVDGYDIQHGIDYMFFGTRDQNMTAEIQNVTNKTEYFEMYSHVLIVPTKEDWEMVKDFLHKKQISIKLPDGEAVK